MKNSRNEKMQDKIPVISKENRSSCSASSGFAGSSQPWSVRSRQETNARIFLMLLAAIRGGVNGLMAEILEDHIRLHMMNPDQEMESPEELGEDLIGLVRAYLK